MYSVFGVGWSLVSRVLQLGCGMPAGGIGGEV